VATEAMPECRDEAGADYLYGRLLSVDVFSGKAHAADPMGL
jgi:hypothetical protein